MSMYKSYTKCAYLNCDKTSQEISMFRIPVLDQERLELWIRNIGNTYLDGLANDELKHRYVCATHFQTSHMRCKNQRNRLVKEAVPIHFLCERKYLESIEEESMCKLLDQITSPHWASLAITPYSITMSYTKCVYQNCSNTGQETALFRFPVHDKERLRVWIRNSGNPDISALSKEDLRLCYICADHFPKSNLNATQERCRLLGPAVPMLYQPGSQKNKEPMDEASKTVHKPFRLPRKKARTIDVSKPLCCCCLATQPEKLLWPKGKVDEVYGRMLHDCFQLDLSSIPNARICSICVSQLRATSRFRQHAMRSAQRLLDNADTIREPLAEKEERRKVADNKRNKSNGKNNKKAKMERDPVEDADESIEHRDAHTPDDDTDVYENSSTGQVPIDTEILVQAVAVMSEADDSDDDRPLRPPAKAEDHDAFIDIPTLMSVKLEASDDDAERPLAEESTDQDTSESTRSSCKRSKRRTDSTSSNYDDR